jgi:DNA invertase Pin-like site-specific DNA recombinase
MLIGYTRCSTSDQADGSTISEQERMIRGVAMMRGVDQFDIVFYSDPAVSGSISLAQRPQGAELVASLKKGDIIIAAKLDRLFRSANDALHVVEDLYQKGVGIILADMGHTPVTENGASKLFFTMLAAFAEFERTRINERTESGREAKKRANGCVGAVPYGWRKTGTRKNAFLVENATEQKNIRLMRTLKVKEITYEQVSVELAAMGIYNRAGLPFNRGQIYELINRRPAIAEQAPEGSL